MRSPVSVTLLVVLGTLGLAPARAQSRPSQPSRPTRTLDRSEDKVRAKYVRRKLPREQRRVEIPGSQAAVHAGLVWLKKHQSPNGMWDCDGFMRHDTKGDPCDGAGNAVHDVGVTGLALLAFLGDGQTHKRGQFQGTVRKGLGFLSKQQNEGTGLFGVAASHDFIYGHIIATYAMVEAYGLSQDAALKVVAENGLKYLESHRNPFGVWRYQPRDGDNDMSITSWAICAYQAGKDFGLKVNKNALKIAANYMDMVTDPVRGRTGYTRRGEPSSRHPGDHATRFPPQKGEAMTAASLFCRALVGQTPAKKPIMKLQADLLLARPAVAAKDGSIDHYYWYYAAHAVYQVGGKHWKAWQEHLHDAVVKQQREDGNFKGSWDPVGVWGEDGGRVYSTAMGVLTLESQYRYGRILPE